MFIYYIILPIIKLVKGVAQDQSCQLFYRPITGLEQEIANLLHLDLVRNVYLRIVWKPFIMTDPEFNFTLENGRRIPRFLQPLYQDP